MVRIANKYLSVNDQDVANATELQTKCNEKYKVIVVYYDPGWGKTHIDPVTGELATYYDSVPRSIKLNSGHRCWILIPRYRTSNTIFRVLPPNIPEFKQYLTDVIQEECDVKLMDMPVAKDEIEVEETNTQEDKAENNNLQEIEYIWEYPCIETKMLWFLWLYKNLPLIEACLGTYFQIQAPICHDNGGTIREKLSKAFCLRLVRKEHPRNWLQIVLQETSNSGHPLVPLRARCAG